MGMTFGIYVNPKHEGVPFHQLEPEIQGLDKFNEEPKEIFYCERSRDVLKFFRGVTHVIVDSNEEGQFYSYIDVDNIEQVQQKIKEKIDSILISADLYDKETYGSDSELYLWSEIHTAIKKFSNSFNMEEWYLLIDAGW